MALKDEIIAPLVHTSNNYSTENQKSNNKTRANMSIAMPEAYADIFTRIKETKEIICVCS